MNQLDSAGEHDLILARCQTLIPRPWGGPEGRGKRVTAAEQLRS